MHFFDTDSILKRIEIYVCTKPFKLKIQKEYFLFFQRGGPADAVENLQKGFGMLWTSMKTKKKAFFFNAKDESESKTPNIDFVPFHSNELVLWKGTKGFKLGHYE